MMADNRMYIKCDACGKTMIIAKNFGGWRTVDYIDGGFNHVDQFLRDHEYCDTSNEYGFQSNFSLVYEDTRKKEREG